MKKLVLPAIVIAAIGGYFYYANMESTAPEPVVAEDAIAEEVETAVAEAKATGEEVIAKASAEADGVMAAVDGDVFADVPEAMENTVDETSEATEDAVDEMAEAAEAIDHAEE